MHNHCHVYKGIYNIIIGFFFMWFYIVCRHEINIFPSFIRQYFREAQEGMYDMVIHVGDFAYNMDTVGIKSQHRKE